jgi:hypothetical protein
MDERGQQGKPIVLRLRATPDPRPSLRHGAQVHPADAVVAEHVLQRGGEPVAPQGTGGSFQLLVLPPDDPGPLAEVAAASGARCRGAGARAGAGRSAS